MWHFFSSTPAKNHEKCDTWVKSLHFFIFDILFKMIKVTESNMWIFIEAVLINDISCIECTLEFKIKGDNFVNDTKIQ